mgnify:CR=1 FL=1
MLLVLLLLEVVGHQNIITLSYKNNISTELYNDWIFVICSHAPLTLSCTVCCYSCVPSHFFGVLHINNKKRETEIVNITRNQIVKEQYNMAQNGITYNCKHIANEVDVFT